RWLCILGWTLVHQVFSLVADFGKGFPKIASTWSKVNLICFFEAGCLRNHSSKGRYFVNSGCLDMSILSEIDFGVELNYRISSTEIQQPLSAQRAGSDMPDLLYVCPFVSGEPVGIKEHGPFERL